MARPSPRTPAVKAVITTLDNLPVLRRQVAVLRSDALVREVVVVDNGSRDATARWLAGTTDLTVVRRPNRGAGPGRNAGLDAAGDFDYVLMLDGGVLPLPGGVSHMLDYLERRSDADVVGLEIADMVTDPGRAARSWPWPIDDGRTYRNTRLSHTAYCLARARAFDGLRFCEEGPFGEPGWGVDDDEMAYRWNEAGITVHVVTRVPVYRRASGSFRRLFRETGIWPNQYGSVYEQRLVWCQQRWPQHRPGVQWGEPWITLLLEPGPTLEPAIRLVKLAHDRLRERRFRDPWADAFNPYSLVVCCPADHPFAGWAGPRRLRQHHGDTIVVDGEVVRRDRSDDALWTGDFLLWHGPPGPEAVRPGAHYWARVDGPARLEAVLRRYAALHPPDEHPPACRRAELVP